MAFRIIGIAPLRVQETSSSVENSILPISPPLVMSRGASETYLYGIPAPIDDFLLGDAQLETQDGVSGVESMLIKHRLEDIWA